MDSTDAEKLSWEAVNSMPEFIVECMEAVIKMCEKVGLVKGTDWVPETITLHGDLDAMVNQLARILNINQAQYNSNPSIAWMLNVIAMTLRTLHMNALDAVERESLK